MVKSWHVYISRINGPFWGESDWFPSQMSDHWCVIVVHMEKLLNKPLKCLFEMLWHLHDDVIKWKHFPRYWPFVRGIHRSSVNSPHQGQWRGALMFSLIYAWINGWVNNREAGDLRRYRAHYDVIVMAWHHNALCICRVRSEVLGPWEPRGVRDP